MTHEWLDTIAAKTEGGPLTLREVLRYAKQNSELGFLHKAIRAALIKQHTTHRGLSASVEELQDAADAFRLERRLLTEKETAAWLEAHQLTLDDLEERALLVVLREKLRQAITAGQVERYFQDNRAALETVTLYHIQVEEEGVARELHLLITEDGEDFHSLAREYSQDEPTRPAGGYLGIFTRQQLAPALSAIAFSAPIGGLLEPLQVEGGWRLIKVESRRAAVLDAHTTEQLTELLFERWLTEKEQSVEVLLLGAL